MIRLLLGITLSEIGGSQQVVYNILSNLPENLYDITLLTAPGGELLDWVTELNEKRTNKVKVIVISCLKRDISIFNDIDAFFRIFSVMTKNKFDIVHFHNSKIGILGRLAARIARIRRVYYTVHGWGLNRDTVGGLYDILSFIERNLARLTTEVVFVSQSDMELGIQNRWAHRTNCRLIYNGISDVQQGYAGIRAKLGISMEIPVIAFVGRLAEPKHPMFAIMVSGHLKALGLEHRLIIIGSGPLRDKCMQLAEERGLHQQVVLLGNRNDVRTLLKEADIFCLFSKREGLPVSIIEAMYAGLPVVASNVGGISELVENHKTGYLLDGLDEEKAARLLSMLIVDRKLCQTMGSAGRTAAMERFSLDSMVSGYRRLYEKL